MSVTGDNDVRVLLVITPGPTYRPHSPLYQVVYQELSKKFRGYIFTSSPKNEKFSISNFGYSSMKSINSRLDIFKFVAYCVFQALKLKLRGARVDLVTTYDPLKTGFIGIIIARLLRAKFAPEVNGVYTSPAEWLDVPDSFEKRIKMTIFPRLMKFVLGRSDGIKLLYDKQIDPLGYQYRKNRIVRHFPNFVPIEHFRNISEEKEILFVGFPFFRKGLDILIKAFKRKSDKYIDWNLKILGWFPNKEELRKAIDNHPRIYYHQPVPHNEMAEHIGSCGIFVLPSRSEAMGRVLVEAMAAGKPRIGAMVDGIPTVINDGIDGVLFKCEDIDDLAAQLDLLMGDAALRTQLGKAGELRAKQEFNKDVYFANLAEFYYAVMGNNGSDALKC